MMKYAFALLSFPLMTQALEYTLQYENDQVRVAKIALQPNEEVGLHRDAYPRAIYGIRGGTLTRYEQDGSTTEVIFPTGDTIYLEADPIGEMHSAKNGPQPLEIIVVDIK